MGSAFALMPAAFAGGASTSALKPCVYACTSDAIAGKAESSVSSDFTPLFNVRSAMRLLGHHHRFESWNVGIRMWP